jgi:pimeloyl-ACP methyl ester carboxylesterase
LSLTIFGLLAVIAAAPFVAETWRRPMSREAQARAPGQFADLSKGRTHFRWSGPVNGPIVVCIHGLSTPSYMFAGTERSLAALGYRVLTFDLYGRGFSDRASGKQTIDFFLAQLRELLENQSIDERLTLVGFSMGGALATAFAAEEGRRISSLVLIAPAGVAPAYDDKYSRVWTLPVIGDWLMRVAGGWALRRELESQINDATIIPDLLDRQAAETRTRGYMPAILSARRNVLSQTLDEDHIAVRDYETPALAIWGRIDPAVPIQAMARLTELNPDCHHVEIKDGGHCIPQTHPSKIADALRTFLFR